jgi:hypothetical protein
MTLFGWWLGCARPDGAPAACEGLHNVIAATGAELVVEADGCGSARVVGFTPVGAGAMSVTLFTSGDRVVAQVVAEEDAVLDGLVATGALELSGSGDVVGSSLPERGEGGAEPGPAPVAGAWAAAAWRSGGGAALVGVAGGATSSSSVEVDGDGFVVTWGGALGVPLAAGQGVYFDPLTLVVGAEPAELWADWGARVVDQAGASARDPLPWGVEAGLADGEVAAALAAWPDAPLVTARGDWPAVAGDFAGDGRDPAALLDPIARAGRLAGFWVRPFAVDPAAPVATEHPEWLVVDAAGDPVSAGGALVLDATDEAATDWLVGELRAGLDGVDLLVLDGLSDAAVAGVRDGGPLGALALQTGLRALRRGLPGVELVAADAPLLAVVGLVDGFRTEGVDPDALRGGLGARMPLAAVLPLDPPAITDGPGPASGALATAALTGTLRFEAASDPALGPVAARITAGLDGPAAPPGPGPWTTFELGPARVLVAPAGSGVTVRGPGGRELIDGVTAGPGSRVLPAGTGEIWVP